MGLISKPDKVKGIFGVLYKEQDLFDHAVQLIESNLSPIDILSEPFPFVETGYYTQEMGSGLTRRYLSLSELIYGECLSDLKILANSLEDELEQDGKRRVNLDPGYLGASNLILASTKNFSQRIDIGQGIYAEVTMLFMHGDFTKLPWTYPDYYNHRDVFCMMRQRYREQLTKESSH